MSDGNLLLTLRQINICLGLFESENETQSIKLERIETLCQLLHCSPNDLFQIDWDTPDGKR